MVFEMYDRCPYSYCFEGFCFQDLLKIACSIILQLLSSVHLVYSYSCINMTAAKKKLLFILLERCDSHMTNNLSLAVHAFTSHILMSFSIDYMLFPWLGNLSPCFREPLLSVEMLPLWLKHMYICIDMEAYASSCPFQTMQQRFSLSGSICQKCYVISIISIHNSLHGVLPTSYYFQSEAIFFH